MLLVYYVLIILFIVTAVLGVILLKSDGADDVIQATMCVGLIIIELIVIIALIVSSKTGKVYRSEYDKIIQNIDSDKTRVIKEDDDITDIYITVNGQEYHFEFKEENNND